MWWKPRADGYVSIDRIQLSSVAAKLFSNTMNHVGNQPVRVSQPSRFNSTCVIPWDYSTFFHLLPFEINAIHITEQSLVLYPSTLTLLLKSSFLHVLRSHLSYNQLRPNSHSHSHSHSHSQATRRVNSSSYSKPDCSLVVHHHAQAFAVIDS